MLNQFCCVGRVANQPKKIATNDMERLNLSLAIPRNFKNSEGVYETDIIDIVVKGDMVNNCLDYLNKGDIAGVRGHLEVNDSVIEVVAEKVTFMVSKKSEEKEDEE
jgi:single-strand DNA-binding protein